MQRLLMVLLLLCSTQVFAAGLQIREGYIRELPPGQTTSAAYMDLVNGSDKSIAIIGASSDSAGTAEIHNHQHNNGMMQMVAVRRLEIPARGHILLAPGSYHLMLINLKHSLHAGEQVGITLFDEQGKFYPVKITVVKTVGADAPKP
ncbi:MAG: hypothetical protein JWM78_1799 [Verrucomicrobiaceae bacterium]|nr:hypothetical protein [Verrucomicrobiaceae bacterium]